MTSNLWVAMILSLVFSACNEPKVQKKVAITAVPSPSPTARPSATPFRKKQPVKKRVVQPEISSSTATTPAPSPVATPEVKVESYPVATKVSGKSGRVTSPYAPNAGEVDVNGMPPGAEVKDPYTGKIFTVP